MGADNTYGEETFNPETKSIVREFADKYQEFFNFFSQEHGLTLTISEMNEILSESNKLNEKLKITYTND